MVDVNNESVPLHIQVLCVKDVDPRTARLYPVPKEKDGTFTYLHVCRVSAKGACSTSRDTKRHSSFAKT